MSDGFESARMKALKLAALGWLDDLKGGREG